MKKTIFVCLVLISLSASAKEWESSWITALEECHHGNHTSAEHLFDLAVDRMENENDWEHPSVYLDRANLYLLLGKYEAALADIDKALDAPNLNNKERLRGVRTRFAAKMKLEIANSMEDIEFLVKNFEIQIENMRDHVIIRNMPESGAVRKTITDLFIRTGICESEEDISFTSSDLCVVHKRVHEHRHEHNETRENQLIISCKIWCDDNAFAAISWCSNYPELCVVGACNSAVFEIQNNCHTCCQHHFPQDTCSAPFRDIVAVMQKYLPSSCGIR